MEADGRSARAGGVSWEMLNAYVDEELPPDIAAEVAAAVARDPSTASHVATLARLRSATRAFPEGQDAPPPVLPRRAPAFALRRTACAASIAALMMLAGALFWGVDHTPPEASSLSHAVAAHSQWIAGTAPSRSGRIPVNLASHEAEGLPDLSMALLQLSYISIDPAMRDGGGVLAGYRGPHGCRLGLWMGPRSSRWGRIPAPADRDGLRIRIWSSDEADYALLSRGMDPLRLDRIAGIVAHMTLRGPHLTREQVAALREIPSVGQPCRT